MATLQKNLQGAKLHKGNYSPTNNSMYSAGGRLWIENLLLQQGRSNALGQSGWAFNGNFIIAYPVFMMYINLTSTSPFSPLKFYKGETQWCYDSLSPSHNCRRMALRGQLLPVPLGHAMAHDQFSSFISDLQDVLLPENLCHINPPK